VATALLFNDNDVPLMISPRGMLEAWALSHRRIKKRLAWNLWQKRVLQAATLLHATSDQEAASIRAVGLQNPIAVIPNGVYIPEIRGERGVPDNHATPQLRRCVYLSRIHEKKGLPLLLHAWSLLRPIGWSLEVAGFGEASYVALITRMIRDLGCDSIRFVGEKTGVAKDDFLRGAQLFVLPSYSENFGMAVAEAMAYGIPVITTHGTPWHVLAEKGMGWWVPPTIESIHDTLQAATHLTFDDLRHMGCEARTYAAEALSWEGVARNLAACYKWVCHGGPVPQHIFFDGMKASI
jgi:glycosyltransferase involved in cell wall biosynthesis